MSTCLVLQHVEPERPYGIGEALAGVGIDVDVRAMFQGDPLPGDLERVDAVVVMGGPMSAVSDEGFPTRAREIDLVAEGLARGLPILGVCLGAQLMAAAAGAPVYPGRRGVEIGWAPVTMLDAAQRDRLFAGVGPELEVLHWHGDTFELPQGATLLASSGKYTNQAFRLGQNAWGLQFHLEVDEDAVRAFFGELWRGGPSPGGRPGRDRRPGTSGARASGARPKPRPRALRRRGPGEH